MTRWFLLFTPIFAFLLAHSESPQWTAFDGPQAFKSELSAGIALHQLRSAKVEPCLSDKTKIETLLAPQEFHVQSLSALLGLLTIERSRHKTPGEGYSGSRAPPTV